MASKAKAARTKAQRRKRLREDLRQIPAAHNGQIIRVSLKQLMAHPDFQRITGVKGNVARIVKQGIDWASFGVPVIQRLPDDPDMYHLVDGQCRIKALAILYPDGVDEDGNEIILVCLLIDGTPNTSGELFIRLNSGKQVAKREKFRIGYNSSLLDHVFVKETLERHNISVPLIGGNAAEGVTLCPYNFLDIYQLPVVDDEGFRFLCRTLTATFSGPSGVYVERAALAADFVRALGLAVNDHDHDVTHFCKGLAHCGMSAADIVKEASDCYSQALVQHGRKRITCLKDEIEVAVELGHEWLSK